MQGVCTVENVSIYQKIAMHPVHGAYYMEKVLHEAMPKKTLFILHYRQFNGLNLASPPLLAI